MRKALIFTSGCLMTALIFWLVSPPCSLAAWFAGFVCALVAMAITLLVEASLTTLGGDK